MNVVHSLIRIGSFFSTQKLPFSPHTNHRDIGEIVVIFFQLVSRVLVIKSVFYVTL